MNPSFLSDVPSIISWWAVMFVIGAAVYPLARLCFSRWWDQGYALSKALGMAVTTFIVWQLGTWKIIPFSVAPIVVALGVTFILGLILQKKLKKDSVLSWKRVLIVELLFLFTLCFWSYIKAHEPDIRSLEKFMDFGFSSSMLNTSYFPPPDMWYAGGTINYYYFGHLTQAILTRLSGVDLSIGYNLMLASLFALCFTMSFAIGVQLFLTACRQGSISFSFIKSSKKARRRMILFAGITGILAAFLVSLSGNMQTIYAFTKGYNSEDTPPPFWNVMWSSEEIVPKFAQGIQTYWYANATRFIPYTIHEFPGYSFVVSDNHGHVLNIPYVLLALASIITLFGMTSSKKSFDALQGTFSYKSWALFIAPYVAFGLLNGMLLMTNALDGPIYFSLFALLIVIQSSGVRIGSFQWFADKAIRLGSLLSGFLLACFPFLITFNSFATGLAVNCPSHLMENTKIGPILFETVDKCQRSPFWMMLLLWGIFWFAGIVLLFLQRKKIKEIQGKKLRVSSINILWQKIPTIDRLLMILSFFGFFLILFAEFFYFKDIYPAHFRSNTMFKLGYQVFIMGSFIVSYVFVRLLASLSHHRHERWETLVYIFLLIPQLFLVSIFPLFSVRSYFGGLQTYKGLSGITWFAREYPDDYKAAMFLRQQVSDNSITRNSKNNAQWLHVLSQTDEHVHNDFFTSHIARTPVILEADGDSYTDYGRISVFSGLPTVIGWGVHEWLWRGSYDVVAPRKEEVRQLYETEDGALIKHLLDKYNIRYVIIGELERRKFPQLNEQRFDQFGTVVFRSGSTVIYTIDK
jgi:YYY domain-containing protein